ncbi:MAG: indole-3-glycerol phosphate synthase TrpC [Chloroflexi bacterium AL-W]|nr:indole-3-glycerol phosphate synthase TrpC [Chloroflexi bacterium AL-N1]NOK70464.1 indole-3-glycerol phosphate synthase TrpC [Chloroflexi bacterium AL-N10]NOK78177.1 indole-3-glycerol phosphate synthase TrpC [Chloroflexi bacterium AL-N5]NOK85276.1 indole-3-glycerol phosphate synthase TrpC [Chloroflexi bacterium AL-W]NOK92041.1 indole-3-glycerol phosphate synthase TrpC [Chloroflexi bacterium AL-N15]
MENPETTTILHEILTHKRTEVARQTVKIPLVQLQKKIATLPPVRDFATALKQPDRVSLIAEVKKASPSKGVLIEQFDPLKLARTYVTNGASALSVLTDVRFFQGSLKYLEGIRALTEKMAEHTPTMDVPLLRKDFILDPYQVYESRAYGADALLLIVAALDDSTLESLLTLTHELGMQALVEVHDATELDRATAVGANIIGVNNRNLHTFATTLETTQHLAAALPDDPRPILISESGLATKEDVARVRTWGVDAILVGEALVTAPDIATKVRELAAKVI